MSALILHHVVDRNGIEGDIVRTLHTEYGTDDQVVVRFRKEHTVVVPASALVAPRRVGPDPGSYFLPLSLTELERYQHVPFG